MSTSEAGTLTGSIIARYYQVFFENRLQARYRPINFARILARELKANDLDVDPTLPTSSPTDFLVAGKIPVRIEAVRHLTINHQSQLRADLRSGGWPVGFILNFGSPRPQFRRAETGSGTLEEAPVT